MIGGKTTSALPSWGRLPTCLFSRKTRIQRQVGNLPHGTYSSADPYCWKMHDRARCVVSRRRVTRVRGGLAIKGLNALVSVLVLVWANWWLTTRPATAGNLFVGNSASLYEYVGGTRTTFASGFTGTNVCPAFDGSGDLFVGDGDKLKEYVNGVLDDLRQRVHRHGRLSGIRQQRPSFS